MSTSHDALVAAFEAGAPLLAHATAGLTAEQAASRPGPGDWSIAQVVGHLLDTDFVMADRIKRLIAEENPTLLAFEENAWVERLDSQSIPVPEAVAFFEANRRWVTRLLRRCTDADFARTGQHSERGPITLERVVSLVTGHVDHHLKFVYAKRENLGVPVEPRYTNGTGVYP